MKIKMTTVLDQRSRKQQRIQMEQRKINGELLVVPLLRIIYRYISFLHMGPTLVCPTWDHMGETNVGPSYVPELII